MCIAFTVFRGQGYFGGFFCIGTIENFHFQVDTDQLSRIFLEENSISADESLRPIGMNQTHSTVSYKNKTYLSHSTIIQSQYESRFNYAIE